LPDEVDMAYANIAQIFASAPAPQPVVDPIPVPPIQQSQPTQPIEPVTSTAEPTVVPTFEREAVDYTGIPQNLEDLMQANNVLPAEIMAATESKGYYPVGTPIQNYDPGYIDGVLVAAWEQVFAMIQEIRNQQTF